MRHARIERRYYAREGFSDQSLGARPQERFGRMIELRDSPFWIDQYQGENEPRYLACRIGNHAIWGLRGGFARHSLRAPQAAAARRLRKGV